MARLLRAYGGQPSYATAWLAPAGRASRSLPQCGSETLARVGARPAFAEPTAGSLRTPLRGWPRLAEPAGASRDAGAKAGARSGTRTRTTFKSGDFKSPASTIPPSGRRDDNGRVFECGAEMRANFALRYLNVIKFYRRSQRKWRRQSLSRLLRPTRGGAAIESTQPFKCYRRQRSKRRTRAKTTALCYLRCLL